MKSLYKRKAGFALLFSLWSAGLIVLADMAYGGCILNLKPYEWAAPFYQWLELHIGYSLTVVGFFALYLALPLAIAGFIISLSIVLHGRLGLKLLGFIGLGLTGVVLWQSAASWALTACGLGLLLIAPHTPSNWDRLGAALLLLLPLTFLLLLRIAARRPAPPATPHDP